MEGLILPNQLLSSAIIAAKLFLSVTGLPAPSIARTVQN
jgi:hypothetical protein